MASRAQIIVTLGPSSESKATFLQMAKKEADMARLNFSWGNDGEKQAQIETVRSAEKSLGKKIPIIADLPGPRIQRGAEHGFDRTSRSSVATSDKEHIRFAVMNKLDYIALSFVGSKADIDEARKEILKHGGNQKIIAKIERKEAVDNIDEIIKASDAVMVARGDLGHEFPVEKIPFIQADIIGRCNDAGKPVITATEMLLSMTGRKEPSRAEVTDIAVAILLGSDAVMLSEETAAGRYPVESVAIMERIMVEAEKRLKGGRVPNILR